jgi:membrane protein
MIRALVERSRGMWHFHSLRDGWALARRVITQIDQDQVLGRSAELAYFFLLAIFPLLLFLTTLLGYLAQGELRAELFAYVRSVAPSRDVAALLRKTLEEIGTARSGGKLTVGIGVALVAASNGVLAVGRVLNTACGYREGRPLWLRFLQSIAITVVFTVLIVVALALLFFGGPLAEWVADTLDLGAVVGWLWSLAQTTLMLVLVVLSFELLYNFAPAARSHDRVWVTPGAVAGTALWLGATFGFRLYLSYFGYYSRIYGSLGVVIVLLLWFYFTGAAILVGGEINSEIAKSHRPPRDLSDGG